MNEFENTVIELVIGKNQPVASGRVAATWLVPDGISLAITDSEGPRPQEQFRVGERFHIDDTEWVVEWIVPIAELTDGEGEGYVLAGRARRVS